MHRHLALLAMAAALLPALAGATISTNTNAGVNTATVDSCVDADDDASNLRNTMATMCKTDGVPCILQLTCSCTHAIELGQLLVEVSCCS
mmetsp:Transcript_36533/g.97604  ORF Transcript_36533/g.97604 Transcript_36533/m.97604 type:complete len:90 (-) Transcript_36533:60-329(-)